MSESASQSEPGKNKYLAERVESPLVRRITLSIGVIITLIAITWATDVWLNMGFTWYDEQAMIACLGLSLGIAYIRYPMNLSKERLSIPWYDVVLALAGMAAAVYFIVIYDDIADNPFAMRPKAFIVGLVVIPLVWEALQLDHGDEVKSWLG